MGAGELAGDFVLYLYHNKLIQANAIASKQIVRSKFKVYLHENDKRCADSVDDLLLENGFICQANDASINFKFAFRELFKYRNNLLEQLDEQQIQKSSLRTLKHVENSIGNDLEPVKPQVDPNSKLYDLIFKFRMNQDVNEDFTLTSKGCYCCQKNFISEEDYTSHIDHHTEETDFEFMNINNIEVLPQRFKIHYRHCLNSHLLLFTLKDLLHSPNSNVIIERIILYRSSSIQYLEENVPYDLLSDGNEFYVDCHLFHLMYEQPFIIIYKYKGEEHTRYLEEHHFLREEYFPQVTNLLTNHVFRRGELEIKDILNDYYPSEAAKSLCSHNIDSNTVDKYDPIIRNYFGGNDELNSENICGVFRILLEMEDFTISRTYAKYKQELVQIKGAGSDYSVKLKSLPDDQSLEAVLKQGDQIKLTSRNKRNNENKPIQYNGYITRIAGMGIYFESKHRNIPIDETYNVSFAPQRLPIIFQHRALEFLQSDQNLRNRLFPIGSILKSSSHIRLEFFNPNISKNFDQKEAVQNIVDNPNRHIAPFIIFGPPGTGKTTVIVESILQLWNKSKGNKILVTAGSNAACDEIAGRLCKAIKEIDPNSMAVLRIFSVSAETRADNMDKNVLEASNLCYGQQFYPALDTIYTYAIVIATLTVTGKLVHAKISNDHFTHVFIDECGASTEVESIVGISRILSSSGHLIVSGDPKQLGPIIQNDRAAKFGLGRSLLERLMDRKCYEKNSITNEYNKSIQARLVNNYRSHKDILYLSNILYYDGDLKTKAPTEIANFALGWSGLRCKNFPIVFESIKGDSKQLNTTSWCNFSELHSVINYVKDLMFFGVNGRKITEKDIGIISPYKKQCSLIRSELDKRGWFGIEAGSVEIFQGQEKPIIIASMVRSKTKKVGFLDNRKRLNVLLTRAQALLIIVGNPETLWQIDGWKQLIEYCSKNNAFVGVKFDISDTKSNGSLSPAQSLQNLSIANKNNNSKHTKKQIKMQQRKDNEKNTQRKNKVQNSAQTSRQVGNKPKRLQVQLPKRERKLQQQHQSFQNLEIQKEPERGTIDWIDSLPTVETSIEKIQNEIRRNAEILSTTLNTTGAIPKFVKVSEVRSPKPNPITGGKLYPNAGLIQEHVNFNDTGIRVKALDTSSNIRGNANFPKSKPFTGEKLYPNDGLIQKHVDNYNDGGIRVKALYTSSNIRENANPFNNSIGAKPLNTSMGIRINSMDASTGVSAKHVGASTTMFKENYPSDRPNPMSNKFQGNRTPSAPFQTPRGQQNSSGYQRNASYETNSNFEFINRNQIKTVSVSQDDPISSSTYMYPSRMAVSKPPKEPKKKNNCVIS